MSANDGNSPDHVQILVVDDEEPIRKMLQQAVFCAGYECAIAGSGKEALEIMKALAVDVVITDIRMPDMSGIQLLSEVKERFDSDVIVMTGYVEDFTYDKIIEKGASEFVHKPLSLKEFLVRLKRVLRERNLLAERKRNHEELKIANIKLLEYTTELNNTIIDLRAVHKELKAAYLDTINRLVMAAEYKDEDTGDHIIRMSRYSALIARKLGLPLEDVQHILYAAPMHDVGKIGIPDNILLKQGRLSREEFEIVKTHTTIGARILADSRADILRYACEIALTHHERWDGRGYPRGLSGTQIPITGRIVGLADVFDALTSIRPYKDPYPVEIALDLIRRERGKHFDPDVLDVFLHGIDEILTIKEEVSSVPVISLADFVWSERDVADSIHVSIDS